ncbi:collagenase-like [Hyposmocoma kahamanoa]|uniref:collagenase-like n=1 Tax=Hyposmocoma kahamanoa TaxID=1477025 RepID=UPI000E6D9CFD|nr:collagenase-like [Hyposmocoma kahamanoa]
MKKILLLFLCFLTCCLATPYDYHERIGVPRATELRDAEMKTWVSRIIGGNQVENMIPHQVGIIVMLTTGWTSICGGALVSNIRVLTAAHCWYDGRSQARLFTLVFGSTTIFSGGTRVPTSNVVVHPSWNTVDVTHDLAMVHMPSVVFSNTIMPIPLPTMEEVNDNFAGLDAIVSGYGKTSDAQNSFPITTSLYHTTVRIITNADCQSSFNNYNLHVGHLCTSGQGAVGTCDGDSGGPLTVVRNSRRILVGIVSFGPGEGCEQGLPSVYTRVTAFLSWVQANL